MALDERLNHGISVRRSPSPIWSRLGGGEFIGHYVFPDSERVEVDDAIRFAGRAGFEMLNAQSLRPHCALTLHAWVDRLEAAAERAIEVSGTEIYRTWCLYMAAVRGGFEDGSLDVVQLLLDKARQRSPGHIAIATLAVNQVLTVRWWAVAEFPVNLCCKALRARPRPYGGCRSAFGRRQGLAHISGCLGQRWLPWPIVRW